MTRLPAATLLAAGGILLAGCGATAPTPAPSSATASKPAASAAAMKAVFAVPAVNITAYGELLPLDKGLFAQHGLAATIQQMAPNTIPAALASGDVHFTNATGAVGPAAVQGLPVRIIAYFQRYEAYSLVAAGSVKSVADLRGKRVALPPPGGDNREYVLAALKQGGLTAKDVQPFPMTGSSQVAEGLIAGNIDAGLLAPPLTQELGQKGFQALTGPRLVELPSGGLGAPLPLIQQQPQLVEAALEGTLDGIAWIRAHPQEAADYFGSKFSLSPDIAKAALNQQMEAVGLTFSDEALQARIQRSLEATQSTRSVAISDVYDFTIFRRLVQAKHLDQ